ncbi:MAG: PAS domain S-box protein [Gammaproteobacteria bacterium]|nr:PAS domain S-box protein [Gammaproteobacteria bacterium]MBU1490814.1 PAS domain S-box protein [Gammaproteobacteria bacterium]MBU2066884.1 PAS domain S-box protein [Gammaproteobacteria bacterium]MBU2137336.1 PAS domain S-box protein [Gammaproteobacteria bacterium]MBU2218244.1 PAS domain S-box protein [Gammaproteobacteria bacterium]
MNRRAWRWLLLGLWINIAWAQAPAPVPLTVEQTTWLRDHEPLRAGVVLQTPYAQFDQRQQSLSGASIDLLNLLAERLGSRLNWRHFKTHAELEAALRAGQIDLAPGLQQTPAGLRRWLFSDPYLRIPHLLVGVPSGAGSVDLENLGGEAPLAVPMPSAVADFLRGSYPGLQLREANNARQALQQVMAQQAAYAVVEASQVARLLRESEFAELAIVGDAGLSQLLRIGSRRDWPQLAAIIDSALRAIPAQELDALQSRWIEPAVRASSTSPAFFRNLSVLLGVLLLSSLALMFSLRRQRDALEFRLLAARHEIELREAARDALRLAQFSIDHSTVGILWVNWDSRVHYANRATEQMLGYGSGGILQRPLADFEPSLSMDRWLNLWKRARQGGQGPLSFASDCVRADGSLLPADVSLSFMRYRENEYLVVFITDVTERRRALAALQESEARLQGIAANVPGLVFRLERPQPGGVVDFAFISEGAENLVGYSAGELMAPDRGLRSLVHPDDRQAYHRSQDAALASDQDWHWQGRILTRAGEQRWADIKAIARRLPTGQVLWDGIVWDISDNKRIELALADSRAQLRELSAHLESVREEEKARIAREVHDELGQVLTVLKLETSMCELSYADLDPGLHERLGNMKRLIAQLFQLVRDVASALRPPILDAGLASAIEWQAQRFEARTQIPCLVEVPDNLPELADGQAIGLFRVLQEALTNVIRHAGAHTVDVRLAVQGATLNLVISDDGRGFRPAAVGSSSFGLVGMRERVLMLGGTLDIDSQPGEGTTLSVRVPLDSEQAFISEEEQT